jgi:hypothetical protein
MACVSGFCVDEEQLSRIKRLTGLLEHQGEFPLAVMPVFILLIPLILEVITQIRRFRPCAGVEWGNGRAGQWIRAVEIALRRIGAMCIRCMCGPKDHDGAAVIQARIPFARRRSNIFAVLLIIRETLKLEFTDLNRDHSFTLGVFSWARQLEDLFRHVPGTDPVAAAYKLPFQQWTTVPLEYLLALAVREAMAQWRHLAQSPIPLPAQERGAIRGFVPKGFGLGLGLGLARAVR